jgi:hypothetical protein
MDNIPLQDSIAPVGVVSDMEMYLFCDYSNNRIRKINNRGITGTFEVLKVQFA